MKLRKYKDLKIFTIFILLFFQNCSTNIGSNKKEEKGINQKTQVIEREGLKDTLRNIVIEINNEEKNNKTILNPSSGSKFKEVMEMVNQIDYSLKKFEKLNKSKNFLNNRIKEINEYRKRRQKSLVKQVNITHLNQVQKAFIKGTIDLGNKLYERATIELWEIDSEDHAIEVFKEIEKLKEDYHWEEISKSPITCFRVKNEIVFITPGGFYMLDKVSKIENFLKKNL